MSDQERVFVIPVSNMPRFTEALAKLGKRAEKIGCPLPTYTLLKEEVKVFQVDTGEVDENDRPILEEKVIIYQHIELHNPTVVIDGYEFVGTLEHMGEEGNVVHTVPGKVVPVQYRTVSSWCDHCQLQRKRNDTFVVHHLATDTHKQIGRNCLALFFGIGAERLAAQAELYAMVGELAGASEGESFGGGGGREYATLSTYLGFVAEVIAHVGWKSRSVAREYGGVATSDIAITHMWRPRGMKERDFLFRTPTEKSLETATAAIAWAESISDTEVEVSDYLYNIRLIARRGVVSSKQFGYAASIVSGYQRHIGELVRKEKQASHVSEWIGTEGERDYFHLLVEKVITSESMYGVSLIHLMSDDLGNKVVWFGHGKALKTGEWVWLKGTVKKHGERNGTRQTVLTRCEEVEMKTYTVSLNGSVYSFQAADPKEARKVALQRLQVPRLPRGTVIAEATEALELA